MVADPNVAGRLVSLVLPLMAFWFIAGFVITLLYHLSLYVIDGEFTSPGELMLDLAVAALRVPLLFIAWPVVLYFDRSVLDRIRMFWSWLDPKARARDEDLQEALRARDQRRALRQQYEQQLGQGLRRDREIADRRARDQRRRRLSDDSPELGSTWLLVGRGRDSGGAEMLVRRYPDAVLPDEIIRHVEDEVRASRSWNCLRCREPLEPTQVQVPEPFFLQVTRFGKPLVEGWALAGRFSQQFAACPKCGAEQPDMTGDMTSFGRADEVLAALESGLVFAAGGGPEARTELEPTWRRPTIGRVINFQARGGLRLLVGLLGMGLVLTTWGVFAWALFFFLSYYGSAGG